MEKFEEGLRGCWDEGVGWPQKDGSKRVSRVRQ